MFKKLKLTTAFILTFASSTKPGNRTYLNAYLPEDSLIRTECNLQNFLFSEVSNKCDHLNSILRLNAALRDKSIKPTPWYQTLFDILRVSTNPSVVEDAVLTILEDLPDYKKRNELNKVLHALAPAPLPENPQE
jgi:hypothetical protein